jgi:hypothetical protein
MKTTMLPLLALTTAMAWAPLSNAQFLGNHVASSFAHENAIHPHPEGVDISPETRSTFYRMRVILEGSVRPLSEASNRFLGRWATAHGLNTSQGMSSHEVLVQEGTARYWVPIRSGIFQTMEKEMRPGAAYDLHLMRLGSTPAGAVYLIERMVAVGPALPDTYPLTDVTITLEQSRCLNHKVVIHGDGRVVYNGGQCPGAVEHREWTINQYRVLELLQHMYRIRFFDMEGDYNLHDEVVMQDGKVEVEQYITIRSDYGRSPDKIITVKIGDYLKRVADLDYANSPQELIALSPKIEEAAEIAKRLQ